MYFQNSWCMKFASFPKNKNSTNYEVSAISANFEASISVDNHKKIMAKILPLSKLCRNIQSLNISSADQPSRLTKPHPLYPLQRFFVTIIWELLSLAANFRLFASLNLFRRSVLSGCVPTARFRSLSAQFLHPFPSISSCAFHCLSQSFFASIFWIIQSLIHALQPYAFCFAAASRHRLRLLRFKIISQINKFNALHCPSLPIKLSLFCSD